MIEYLLITAAGIGPAVSNRARLEALSRAIQYYKPLGCNIIVALTKSVFDDYALTNLASKESLISYSIVPNGVKGALATANFALASHGAEWGKLHIAAGDTHFTDDSALEAISRLSSSNVDAGALVFESDDIRHSFVSLDESDNVRFVAEKKLVGKFATSGNFYFADIKDFVDASEWCFVNNSNLEGNFFVSTALNYYVYQGKQVKVESINPNSIAKLWSSARATYRG